MPLLEGHLYGTKTWCEVTGDGVAPVVSRGSPDSGDQGHAGRTGAVADAFLNGAANVTPGGGGRWG